MRVYDKLQESSYKPKPSATTPSAFVQMSDPSQSSLVILHVVITKKHKQTVNCKLKIKDLLDCSRYLRLYGITA